MDRIPTTADWIADPAASLQAHIALATKLTTDSGSSAGIIALGIAGQVLAAAAPIAGEALAGPLGAAGGQLVATAITVAASSIQSQHATALQALTPDQQALVTTAVVTGTALATAKLSKP